MKLSVYFDNLRSALEPEPERKKEAQEAHNPVRDHLATHESFVERHLKTRLYGSYKRDTAIGDIKDVDIVVVGDFKKSDHPIDVLNELKDSLAELYPEPTLADQRRSIRVDRPLPDNPDSELTLDVIPAIYQDAEDIEGALWVPDRDKEIWVASHPFGHLNFTRELNAESYQSVTFVRFAKMVKWWWKYQFEQKNLGVAGHKRKPKGFWLEVMAGQFTDLSLESYSELFVSLFENAHSSFKLTRNNGYLPTLNDPGLEGQRIKTSITEDEFDSFLDTLGESLEWAKEAVAAAEDGEEDKAVEYWQNIFGDKFTRSVANSAKSSLLGAPVTPIGGSLRFPDKPIVPNKPKGFA